MVRLNMHLQRLDEVVLAVKQDCALVRADVDVTRIYAWLAYKDLCTPRERYILVGRMKSATTNGDCVALNDL